ncbi:helix-turn-helix transcriptional regulator [Microbacterium oxydans]|uniref:helix-turn-helix transcriptional regulator n=1 Tax=Microbacterium oxydans TaxID=82380 RepID=UPI0024ADD341|nr:helix-turn-helix domain-containing protein [Microbacterium oxydans]
MDELMTPEQLAEYLQVSTGSLANDRYLGKGPRFVKLGAKLVRYRRADVTAWLEENQYTRTDVRVAV